MCAIVHSHTEAQNRKKENRTQLPFASLMTGKLQWVYCAVLCVIWSMHINCQAHSYRAQRVHCALLARSLAIYRLLLIAAQHSLIRINNGVLFNFRWMCFQLWNTPWCSAHSQGTDASLHSVSYRLCIFFCFFSFFCRFRVRIEADRMEEKRTCKQFTWMKFFASNAATMTTETAIEEKKSILKALRTNECGAR